MTGLPEFFQQTSDLPYDRHLYRLVLTDGRAHVFDDYEHAKVMWFQMDGMFTSHIDVLDKPKVRKKAKGF